MSEKEKDYITELLQKAVKPSPTALLERMTGFEYNMEWARLPKPEKHKHAEHDAVVKHDGVGSLVDVSTHRKDN